MVIQHYEGKLGKFDYNDEEFRFDIFSGRFCYIGNEIDGSKIKIPEGIKDCGDMFYGCESLEKAPVIPEGVENCGYMFSGCKNLKEAPVIPKSVKYCNAMFDMCVNLKEAPVIPEGVIDCSFMFNGCENLEKASVIPESVEYRNSMFYGCHNLKEDCGKGYYKDGPGKKIKDSINKVMSKAGFINNNDFEKKGLGE